MSYEYGSCASCGESSSGRQAVGDPPRGRSCGVVGRIAAVHEGRALRTLSQAPDLKAAASSIPLWLDLFSWAYLIGLAASAYGVWTRHRAARLVFSGLLAITVVTTVVSTLSIVASLSSASGLPPRSSFR